MWEIIHDALVHLWKELPSYASALAAFGSLWLGIKSHAFSRRLARAEVVKELRGLVSAAKRPLLEMLLAVARIERANEFINRPGALNSDGMTPLDVKEEQIKSFRILIVDFTHQLNEIYLINDSRHKDLDAEHAKILPEMPTVEMQAVHDKINELLNETVEDEQKKAL